MKTSNFRTGISIIVTALFFVCINFSVSAQISVAIYIQQGESDSLVTERTYDTGYLLFDNRSEAEKESGDIHFFLIDEASGDSLQRKSFHYWDGPSHIEGKGMLFTVQENNSDDDSTFAIARLENGEEVWVLYEDSYVIFKGDIRFQETELK